MRVLEGKKVPYEAFAYAPELHVATDVARAIGFPAPEVYKTLVVLREKGRPLLVMLASEREVDLRRLAKSVGEKSLRMAPHKEAERLTGLQVGGISALALLNRGFDICVDVPALELESICISAGKRGINLRLKVADLIEVTRAQPVEASTPPGEAPE
ncbi:MAG: YbaK/EbsC family protein [Chloroflexota bacterium]